MICWYTFFALAGGAIFQERAPALVFPYLPVPHILQNRSWLALPSVESLFAASLVHALP